MDAKNTPQGVIIASKFTTLERGGEVNFKPRGLEGTNVQGIQPETLLLDGQQRITSLYQTLYSMQPALMDRGRGVYAKRHFFLDIRRR